MNSCKVFTNKFLTAFLALIFLLAFSFFGLNVTNAQVSAQSFNYSINKIPSLAYIPKDLGLRAEFYTSFYQSTPERKHNVRLAGEKINLAFLNVGEEFSFNKTVGERTEKNGFLMAKIILNNRFVDGYGGGVCQVSSTLYNAVLLSGLKITEYHPHSLPVSYVAPSFDAMVNSGSADLRFINDTRAPIIIAVSTTDCQIKISVYGEKMQEKYVRKSVITGEVPAPPEEVKTDYDLEYPDVYLGQQKTLSYSKNGFYSQGTLVKYVDGKIVSTKLIRKDKYNAIKGLIIKGTATPPDLLEEPCELI